MFNYNYNKYLFPRRMNKDFFTINNNEQKRDIHNMGLVNKDLNMIRENDNNNILENEQNNNYRTISN